MSNRFYNRSQPKSITSSNVSSMWYAQCMTGTRGNVLSNMSNVLLAFRKANELNKAFALNSFTNTIMVVRELPTDDGWAGQRELRDSDYLKLQDWLQLQGLNTASRNDVIGAISVVAEENAFHPVMDYLNNLEWDGIPRIDTMLQTYFQAEEQPPRYLETVARVLMVQAVSRIFNPGQQADYVVILVGNTGLGKSTGLRALFGKDWFTDSMPENLLSKDALMTMAGVWGIELPELAQFRRAEVTSIKRFITIQRDKYRPPYGRNPIEVPRQCVFVGTTNEHQFLTDDTGNRRFMPVLISEWAGQIDREGIARDRDQLWAEAVYMFNHGITPYPPLETTPIINECTEQFLIDNPVEERLASFLNGKNVATMQEIFDGLGISYNPRGGEIKMVQGMLRRLNWRPGKHNGVRCWFPPRS